MFVSGTTPFAGPGPYPGVGSISSAPRLGPASLGDILRSRRLTAHFQPVVDLTQGRIYGHESLIRGPADTVFHMPERLFSEARRQGVHPQLELASAHTGLQAFHSQASDTAGYLFVNMSASALVHFWTIWGDEMPTRILAGLALEPGRIVIELTEHDPAAPNMGALSEAFASLRAQGMRVALDDYGVGHSSLQLWAEVQPDLVKIDRYFFDGISTDEHKQKLVRAVLAVAQCYGTPTVAEGIENAEDLAAVRDLGVRYAQGWFLGRPQVDPLLDISGEVKEMLARRAPQRVGATRNTSSTVAALRVDAPAVSHGRHTNDDVHRLFAEHKSLHAVAVVDDGNRPVGIINRRDFTDRYAQRYTRELFGRDPCSTFMNGEPVLVDAQSSIDQLSHVLISQDQRYLVDGFIVTRDGSYDGLGTGEALVRSVTEMRIEAARYANPLTSLPGNIPISQHIGALLESGVEFVTGYCDLNNFKPFNDVYGYWRGDDMILLCADIVREHCDPQRDFVGHVGGDDFVVLMRSPDWHRRLENIITQFDLRARDLYDDTGRASGGIEAEDRHGVMRFFPFVTLGIGALRVEPASYDRIRPEDIASAAAQVKHKVKHGNAALVVERYAGVIRD
ncbi:MULTISPECIES: EAL domain-containing protein [unclassified Achromobacter]|uniref:EAL domain-containing protein n=1 Tax=unclassified Achromobacter TaxID=2626865 RepID=UPI000B51B349|nr:MULTISPECIES: EAL domain-containing protein [unclassified Achromobacter]OWT80064.1 GGDEF domain-containing protein [Achromobacter sp. HZ34]OWT81947.1 GGDEF domain-containing protein [Achromobacter sp. HZ28]